LCTSEAFSVHTVMPCAIRVAFHPASPAPRSSPPRNLSRRRSYDHRIPNRRETAILTLPSDLAVWDGHIAMIVGNVDDDRSQLSIGVQVGRRAGSPGSWSLVGLGTPALAAIRVVDALGVAMPSLKGYRANRG
jgi:hypothetical protein